MFFVNKQKAAMAITQTAGMFSTWTIDMQTAGMFSTWTIDMQTPEFRPSRYVQTEWRNFRCFTEIYA